MAATSQADIDAVVAHWHEKGVTLRMDGNIAAPAHSRDAADSPPDIKNAALIDSARAFLRDNAIPMKRASAKSFGSYDGKHDFEDRTSTYITNGEFIVACALEGLTVSFGRKSEPKRLNAVIGAKWCPTVQPVAKPALKPGQ